MIRLKAQLHPRVWGGHRLAEGPDQIGEAWVVYGGNTIEGGPHHGVTLDELVHEHRNWLLGSRGEQHPQFPLLIKLLDCQDWLSIQVHPNDEQAVKWHGPGHQGKTEAWHILNAEKDAQVMLGIREGTTPQDLREAILAAQVEPLCEYQNVSVGDTLYIPAGTLHALGPGLLIYEVQQTSDLTYRVFDWDRPQSAGRTLHLEQSAEVTRADLRGEVHPLPDVHGTGVHRLVTSPYFQTELLHLESAVDAQTSGETFHVLTVTQGEVQVKGEDMFHLKPHETVLVPAAPTDYSLVPLTGSARILRSTLP
ncbi:type I phosphomannose isomerase catalytic subunit [Deinococcus cellulosilyticus]|uniref:Mannose-6-phosphate isomerase n=1 Tax=Deinococcus cellulosilyticus (strain DSM 18568 / NBRC 106333 / KACC 11606 / 5516J-15) TaxID=1223518 RepID=A0A511MV22_DEIC1|nr:type I phosphomannose isomerase catalytic subunit [Deinococcus cellulosilyticus]GEM44432.1 mannose-6-phosphate isomerase [Deinococcus cellulosilyticus NBRC 106333 = KACC 11606]